MTAICSAGGTTPMAIAGTPVTSSWPSCPRRRCEPRSDGCRILRGRWSDPYTGRIETDAGDLDVDHIVPLAWAWDHGADQWSRVRRERFANDPINLVPTDRGVNRSKGADGPDEWLPPDATGHCGYVLRFLRIARSYELTIGEAEARRIEAVRGRVCA